MFSQRFYAHTTVSKKQDVVHFEWSFAEEGAVWHDAEWSPALPLYAPAYTSPSPDVYRLPTPPLQAVVLLLIALLSSASVALIPQQHDPARLQRIATAILQQEERVWQQNDIPRFRRLLDFQTEPAWRSDWSMPWGIQSDQRATLGVQITHAAMQEDRLLLQTVITQPMMAWWRAAPYREQRFYRRSSEGWLRTSPAPEDWGPIRTVATPHFRFQFHERDTPAILELSVQIELAYLQLYQLLGRSPPATPITLTFAVVPDHMRELRMSDEPLRFASPRLLKTPQGLTEIEYATHLVLSHLADRALLEILKRPERNQVNRWRTLFWGASGRLRLAVLGQRSPWQQEADAFFWQTHPSPRPLRLTDIDDRYTGITLPREAYLWEYRAAEALIDYVVERYGWAGVVALFDEFGRSTYWSKIIPRVFDRSATDLEAEWNRYLAESYDKVTR